MFLTAIYWRVMVSIDLFKIGMPESIKEKQKEEAIKQAMKNLLSEKIISKSRFIYWRVMVSIDLFKIGMPESIKEKQKEEAIKQAMKNLLSEKIISKSRLIF